MEARPEAIPSPIGLWWSKLGKWQALMVVITLIVFFVTLGITGDKVIAAAIVVAAVLAAFAGVAIAVVDEIPGVSKKVVWFSYIGELLLILPPMLWAIYR